MPSSGRHILDIKKKASSRTKARAHMAQLFSAPSRSKPVRLRHQRQKRRLVLAAVGVLFLCLIGGGLAAVSHLEQFSVREIAVMGAETTSVEELTASAAASLYDGRFHLFSRENIFLYPREAIERAIVGTFPRVKMASVTRPSLLAQSVVVTIEERNPYALWCPSGVVGTPLGTSVERCYLMDSAGYIFAEDDGSASLISYPFSGGLAPGYTPIGQWFLRGRLHEVIALVDRLRKAGYETIAVSVDSEKDLSLQFAEGPRLRLLFGMEADTVVRNLEIALATEDLREQFGTLEYIDLRFGNRVYYK